MNLADRIVHMERGRIESNVVVAERLFVREWLRQSPAFAAILPEEQEKIADEILLEYAVTLAPEIEATAPGVCTVHFSSLKNYRAEIERVVRQLAELHLRAQVGLAATPDLSFLAACLAQPILQIDDPQNFLAPLPLETLLHLVPAEKTCHRSVVS